MRRTIVILSLCIPAAAALIVLVVWPRTGDSSVSTTLIATGQGTLWGLTNQTFASFVVSNSVSHRLYFHGIADEGSRMHARVLAPEGWVDAKELWGFYPHAFYLSPGQTQQVTVQIKTNRTWRVAFRFRDTGYVDLVPISVWWSLPDRLYNPPKFKTAWTEPMRIVERYVEN